VLPRSRQATGSIDPEEVSQRGLPEAVEVLVCPKDCQLGVEVYARLFANFSARGLSQVFACMDAPRRNLRASLGVITMVEYE
jgi:hypothetical protein